jgi:hypothetical protein
MHQATISVKYVNQPDKNPDYGSLRDANGNYWGVPKNMFSQFQPDHSYCVGYTTFTAKTGKEYHTIKEIKVDAPVLPKSCTPPATNGNGQRMNGDKDRFIFMCGALNRFIQTGKLSVDADQIEVAIRQLYRGYDQAHGIAEQIEDTF